MRKKTVFFSYGRILVECDKNRFLMGGKVTYMCMYVCVCEEGVQVGGVWGGGLPSVF